MAGLNEIIDQILKEGQVSADSITAKARAQAEQIKKEAGEEAARQEKTIAAKSRQDVISYGERIKSNADLQRRTALLTAKQEIISEVLQKAYEKFCKQDDRTYFETLKKMVRLYAEAQNGEICFSKEDVQKMPKGFMGEVSAIAAEKGGTLKLSGETRPIEKGFVLIYGGVEENCTFRALFDAKQNDLTDLIHKEIFL